MDTYGFMVDHFGFTPRKVVIFLRKNLRKEVRKGFIALHCFFKQIILLAKVLLYNILYDSGKNSFWEGLAGL